MSDFRMSPPELAAVEFSITLSTATIVLFSLANAIGIINIKQKIENNAIYLILFNFLPPSKQFNHIRS